MVLGDLNVHQKSWLRFSSKDTPEGKLLRDICAAEGLRQIVREPTRDTYLLDLVITDIDGASFVVGGKVRDHKLVIGCLNFSVVENNDYTQSVEICPSRLGKAM